MAARRSPAARSRRPAGRDGHSLAPPRAHATPARPGPPRAPPLALTELARRPALAPSHCPSPHAGPREEGGGPGSRGVGRAVCLGGGGGGARGRNELTGREPPTRHCGSPGKAGGEKGGGRDRDLGLQPAREAGAGRGRGRGQRPSAISAASAPGVRGRPGRDRGSSGISGPTEGLSWRRRAAGVPARAEEAEFALSGRGHSPGRAELERPKG